MAKNGLQLFIRSQEAQKSIQDTLKDNSDDFSTSLINAINSNPVLQECDAAEVVRTALKAASMHLPIDPALGMAFIIPYRNKKKWKVTETRNGKSFDVWHEEWKYEPQLQIGWKGFIELGLRTKQYLRINATDVRQGEYLGLDRMTGDITFNWLSDADRKDLPVVGYLGYIKLVGGFEKQLYMTVEDLEDHAKKYSKSYANGNGVWKDQKRAMSIKTVLKLLIANYGPKSTQIQKALRADQAAMGDEDTYKYLDNDKTAETGPNDGQASSRDDTPEAEVVDNVDQTPAEPTEAEAPQAEPRVTLSDKDREAIGASISELGLTSRGTMGLLDRVVHKTVIKMIKTNNEWLALQKFVADINAGSVKLPDDWFVQGHDN